MDPVIIDAGTLTFSDEDMAATGLLVPYGVKARSNLGEFEVDAGVFTVPADVTGASLNVEHAREDVVGGFSKAWEQPEGIMGTFKFAETDEGRKAYADAKSGKRKNLSAEVAGVRIRDGRAISGRLFAAALVEKPAFEGATLLAAEDTPSSEVYESPEAASSSQYVTEFTDSKGVKWRRIETNTSSTTVEKVETPEADPAEDNPEGGSTVTATATKPGQQAPAPVPGTLLAGAPTGAAPGAEKRDDIDLGSIFAAMSTVKSGIGSLEDAETLLAALTDIKYDAAGGLTTAGSGILQPAWVGKLWQGRRYQRKYIDLCTHLFGGIQLGGRGGYTMTAGSELVQEWAGNKNDIPSGGASTAKKNSTLKKYGWAADIAREWFDLEGGADLIEELLKLVVDSYARVTDQRALTDIFTAASRTSAALDRLVAPESLPSGTPANSAYYPAVVQLIQAIEAISDADDDPSFAVVNPTAWKQLIYTPKELLPEYVSLSVSAGTGSGTVDGKVTVRKAPQSFFTGTVSANPQVIAGAKGAIEFRETGETPIAINALDIARGGVDEARVGYLETFVVRPESLVLIGTKP